ncbi:MAG TPA: molybdopterin-synthase adenylyltransferase MoeB [Sneathiellales bacterium]|nr:molybdopterin-synthase adenylyltransferase MoeB [Sneathiellales bacterium]
MDLSDDQLDRYARHIILKEVGGAGQAKLLNAKVLVVGAGGLGSPLLMYLAAAGVGTLGVVDDDEVSLSNLQRQIIHTTANIGRSKTDSAAETIAAVNPDVRVVRHNTRLNIDNALELIGSYDVIADGCDNFETRFLINDACHLAKRPLVSAALGQFEGQLATFRSYDAAGDKPCYRCIFPAPPPPGSVPSCADGGILGAIAGVMGTLQGVEVLKEILGIGRSLAGSLIIYDALSAEFRKVAVRPDPVCALCSSKPSITDLSAHAA